MSNSARIRTKNTGNSHIWQSKVCSNNNNSICDTEEWSRRGSGFGAAEHARPAAWPLQRVSAARHRKLPKFKNPWFCQYFCGLIWGAEGVSCEGMAPQSFGGGQLRMPDTCGGGAIHGATTERVYARRVNASRSDDNYTNHRAFSISALLKILISSFAPHQGTNILHCASASLPAAATEHPCKPPRLVRLMRLLSQLPKRLLFGM